MDVAGALGDSVVVDKSVENSEFWHGVEGYHEHLRLSDQDEEAHAASESLVATIRERLGSPDSILELGCGAGRNLWHLGQAFPNARVQGLDINPAGAQSGDWPPNVHIDQADVLKVDWRELGNFDMILTAVFLMHINNEKSSLHVHFELHGPSSEWDYHRYPRSYRALMDDLDLPVDVYRIYAGDATYSYGLPPAFAHALLTSRSVT